MRKSNGDTPHTGTDSDDIPEFDAEWAESAYLYEGDKMVKRGRGHPPLEQLPQTIHNSKGQ